MAMIMVVPGEELVAEHPGVFDAAEPLREVRRVQRLELGLGVRVVVGAVRPGVAFGDAEVGEQEGDRLGGHRGAAVGVQGELVAADALLADRLGDQPFGEDRGLTMRDHAADRVPGEDSRITYR
jgi:hypothetical protein